MHISLKVVCVLFFVEVCRASVEGDYGKVQSEEGTDLETNLITRDDGVVSGDLLRNVSTGGQSVDVTCALVTDDESGSIHNCSGKDNVTQDVGIKTSTNESTSDVGERLILTGMVETGNISEARRLSQVSGGPFPAHIASYSGFLTVDHRFNSNLFFWFFPCEVDYENAPVILWLQGGPGVSSLVGLFNEIGPFSIASDGASLVENPNSWHKNHSIVFIDNPVGTGFSYTEDDDGYATNQTQIGDSLYSAMIQFFKLFPEIQKNDFFISGESYAGKYVPTLARTIHARNPGADLKINLKGISVGNGYTDPINMVEMSDFVYQLGLVDSDLRDRMKSIEQRCLQSLLNGEMEIATKLTWVLLTVFAYSTGYRHFYNLLITVTPKNEDLFASFVERPDVRIGIHVGDTNFITINNTNVSIAFEKLVIEHMVSVKPALEELLEHYRVLYYSGQLDLTVTYPMSVNMYQSLNWTAAEEYKHAERVPWYVNGEVAGYMKSAGKFTEVLVRNAGHMVPKDQPVWARDLITRFTSDNLPRP